MTKRRPLALGAAAALGLGSLFIAAPAMAEDASPTEPTTQQDNQVSDLTVASPTGDAVQAAAARNEVPVAEIESKLQAGEIVIAQSGHIAIVDPAAPSAPEQLPAARKAGDAVAIPGDAVGGSRPGAPVTIYLDFDGEVVEGTSWNVPSEGLPGQPSYDMAPAATVDQNAVWAGVAEDYAPFNVNVTTTNPGADALYKTSAGDNTYGSHVVITDTLPDFGEGSGGIAFLGGLGSPSLSPAFVFTEGVGGGDPANATAQSVVVAASHEVGHNLGLSHDGFGAEEYYQPEGGLWGPIMGAPYYSPLTQWSNGEYATANNQENDLAVMTDRGASESMFVGWTYANGDPYTEDQACIPAGVDAQNPNPGDVIYALGAGGGCNPAGEALTPAFEYTDRADFAADDHGDDAANATARDDSQDTISEQGVIGGTNDVDVFKFTTLGGAVSATVDVAEIGPNLDSKLTLTDAEGTVVAEDAPATTRVSESVAAGLGSSVSANVEAGVYYLTVDGVGQGDPASATAAEANGYSDYGSLGNYTLTGLAPAFDPAPIVIETPAEGDTIAAGGVDVTVTGTAELNADVTLTANGTDVNTTANAAGAWTATIKAAVAGKTKIVAAESVIGIPVEATDSVTVVAPVAAPVITTPADGDLTSVSPTFAGTGIAGAEVALTIVDAGGVESAATATVDADGNWTLPLELALAPGEYTVTAVESLNGVTSDASEAVAFTVVAEASAGTGGNAGAGGTTGTEGTGTTGAGAGAEGTTGAGGAAVEGNTNLASTGTEFDFAATLGFITLALLLSGGVIAAVAIRQRKLRMIG